MINISSTDPTCNFSLIPQIIKDTFVSQNKVVYKVYTSLLNDLVFYQQTGISYLYSDLVMGTPPRGSFKEVGIDYVRKTIHLRINYSFVQTILTKAKETD